MYVIDVIVFALAPQKSPNHSVRNQTWSGALDFRHEKSHFLSAKIGNVKVKRRLISGQNSVMDIGTLRLETKHKNRIVYIDVSYIQIRFMIQLSRRWFQIFCLLSPLFGEDSHFD